RAHPGQRSPDPAHSWTVGGRADDNARAPLPPPPRRRRRRRARLCRAPYRLLQHAPLVGINFPSHLSTVARRYLAPEPSASLVAAGAPPWCRSTASSSQLTSSPTISVLSYPKCVAAFCANGALSLQDIVRRLELSPGQVKNSLLILIQHNCVQAYTSPRGAGDRTVTLYLAIFDNVLHRLRFSKFLSVVRVDIPESEVLLEGLLQNGRLTFEQLVERTIFKVSEDSPLPTREEVRMNFNKLVYAHYVERCPKPEPFFDPLAVEQPTSTRKRAPKTVEAVLSLEQKVVLYCSSI
uniref:DNA-directed RNA polymerase III subunit RPC3 n=1 Tax=Zea mays TaxID=4577 RepID=A0A804RLF8_MAIZE